MTMLNVSGATGCYAAQAHPIYHHQHARLSLRRDLSHSRLAAHSQHLADAALSDLTTVSSPQSIPVAPVSACLHPLLISAASPAAYIQQWGSATRPRLDALWSAVIQTNNAERLLLTLDDLLMQLRSCRSTAVHIQQHHTDPTWAAAGSQVAADCSKYERYINSNRTVARRLQALQHSLNQQLQHELVSGIAAQAEAARESGQHHKSVHQQQHVRAADASILGLQQQHDLCFMLLQSLQPSGVEDAMQWLAALELPDVNLQQMQRLQQQEKQITAAIDAVFNQPVAVELPAALEQLLQPTRTPTSSSMDQTGDGALQPSSSIFDSISTQHQSAELAQQGQQHQQQQQQAVLVNVTKGLLARLLQQCPDPAVRQQLHEEVLQPKLQQASRLLGQLARCRLYQARLSGYDSYYAMTQQRLQAASADDSLQADLAGGSHQIEFLIQLQESLQPLCQQEVDWIISSIRTQHPQQQHQQQHQQQDEEERQEQQEPQQLRPQQLDLVECTGPCQGDWDYLQHQATLRYSSALQKDAGLLQQHLQLSGVVAGFSSLLQDLLGLQLVPQAAAAVGARVWAPHVLVLDVVQQQQHEQQKQVPDAHQQASEVLGTIYIDIGGGYGARMLRYARRPPGTAGASAAAALHALPAVAVGISGARLTAQQAQQQAGVAGVAAQGADSFGVTGGDLVLSVAQLWELAHELGHAVHLVASGRQPACHLSGRFLPPHSLELPPQLMERLMMLPDVLAAVCRRPATHQPMPAHLADALAAYYGSRYGSALAVSARVATSLAELMYGEYGGDMEDYWRGAWEAAAGLPAGVAAAGSLREVALMPVMAAHQGTYHCYLTAWREAAELYQHVFRPLLLQQTSALEVQRQAATASLQARALEVFSAHVGGKRSGQLSQQPLLEEQLLTAVWSPKPA